MISNLKGNFEDVQYPNEHFIILHDNNTNENFPLHWHDAIEIIMPLENNFEVFAGGNTYYLNERDILIIPPGDLHSLNAPDTGQRLIFLCNNSVLSRSEALSSISEVFTKVILINQNSSVSTSSATKKAMLDIYEEYFKGTELSELKVYVKLIEMLIAVYEGEILSQKKLSGITDEKLGEYNERIGFILKYIEKNYTEDLTLDKLAEISGYSKFHFSRIFKRYVGISHTDYVSKVRVNAVQQLLLDPELSITEVAMNSGFSSISSFNRIFKKIKHCTPSEFKNFYIKSFHHINGKYHKI